MLEVVETKEGRFRGRIERPANGWVRNSRLRLTAKFSLFPPTWEGALRDFRLGHFGARSLFLGTNSSLLLLNFVGCWTFQVSIAHPAFGWAWLMRGAMSEDHTELFPLGRRVRPLSFFELRRTIRTNSPRIARFTQSSFEFRKMTCACIVVL